MICEGGTMTYWEGFKKAAGMFFNKEAVVFALVGALIYTLGMYATDRDVRAMLNSWFRKRP